MKPKLILFDIDGTLIRRDTIASGSHEASFEYRVSRAVEDIFAIKVKPDLELYNGMIDREIFWHVVRNEGVSREVFEVHFPRLAEKFYEYILQQAKAYSSLYEAIPESTTLIERLSLENPQYIRGVLTGNVERVAQWKLASTGFSSYIQFGLYGDEADDRISLAHRVFEKAKIMLGTTFAPDDIIVIGDTVHDVRCGKAIGAYTVSVTTGYKIDRSDLVAEYPDIIVDSLLDSKILDLFQLSRRRSTINV